MDSVVSLALIVSVCSSVYIFAYAVDLDFEKMTNGQFWLFSRGENIDRWSIL